MGIGEIEGTKKRENKQKEGNNERETERVMNGKYRQQENGRVRGTENGLKRESQLVNEGMRDREKKRKENDQENERVAR